MWRRAAVSAVRPFRSRLLAGRRGCPSTGGAVRAASSSNIKPAVAEAAAAVSMEIEGTGSISAVVEAGSKRLSMVAQVPESDMPEDLLSAPRLPTTCETEVFLVGTGNREKLMTELEEDIQNCSIDLSVQSLMKLYTDEVLPALELRCLVSPFSLAGEDAAKLHHSYKAVIGSHPRYLTSLDLMVDLKTKHKGHWARFFDYLSQEKLLVVRDWNKPLCTASSSTLYDYGMILATEVNSKRKSFKAQADASLKGEVARLSFIISHGKQVIASQVYEGIACEQGDSNQAEALSMYILLKRGIDLGLHLHNFIVCTDNQVVYQILTGSRKITEDDKHRKLYMLLRHMRSRYKYLVCIKDPREKLGLVDQLSREPVGKDSKEKMTAYISRALQDWAPRLQGDPVFIVSDHKDSRTTKLVNQEMYVENFHQRCYLQIEEHHKVDALWHIASALRVHSIVYVAVEDLERRPSIRKQMMELFSEVADCTDKSVGVPLLTFTQYGLPKSERLPNDLLIVYDATAPVDLPNTWDPFIIYLSTADETTQMEARSLPKYNPLSFISFHATKLEGAKQRLKEKQKFQKAKEADKKRIKRRLRKAKEDDNKILCKIQESLSVIISSTSIRKENQVLLDSAKEEVKLCISTLQREVTERSMAAREESDKSLEIARRDRTLIAQIQKFNATLKGVEKEIQNMLIQHGNCQPLLHSCRNNSNVTREVLALTYIQDIIQKGGVHEIIQCYKDRNDSC